MPIEVMRQVSGMDSYQWIMIGLGVAGFIVQGVFLAVTGTWKLTRLEVSIRKEILDHRKELDTALDNELRLWNETLLALRQKINDVELKGFQIFVRRDSFHEIMNRVSSEFKSYQEGMGARMDRLDMKLDRIIENRVGPAKP